MTRIAGRPSLVHVDEDNPATRALAVSGLEHSITRHGRVASLAEAAAARGVDPSAIVKTMVVRRSGATTSSSSCPVIARSRGPSSGRSSA